MNPFGKDMKTRCLLVLAITMVACSTVFGIPQGYGGAKIEGRVDKIEKAGIRAGFGGPPPYSEVHLTEASGTNRKQANAIFKVIRRSGYLATRKTLRKAEIVVIITEEEASKLQVGDRIQLIHYYALTTEHGGFLGGSAKQIQKTPNYPTRRSTVIRGTPLVFEKFFGSRSSFAGPMC